MTRPVPQARVVHVKISSEQQKHLPRVKEIIVSHSGSDRVILHLDSPGGHTLLELDSCFNVDSTPEFVGALELILGNARVEVVVDEGSAPLVEKA